MPETTLKQGFIDSIMDNKAKDFVRAKLAPENILRMLNRVRGEMDAYVASTPNTVDDTILDWVEESMPLEPMAKTLSSELQIIFGLIETETGFRQSAGDGHSLTGGSHSSYCSRVRNECVRQLRKEKGLSRKDARNKVNKLTDEQILDESEKQGITRNASMNFSGILDWIKTHWPDILKVVMSLLPLVLMFI